MGTPLPSREGAQHPHFSAHVYCGQTVPQFIAKQGPSIAMSQPPLG